MNRAASLICAITLFTATIASAERNLIPTLNSRPDVCPEQPPEPDWMQNIDVRESHKRLLVQQIYRAQSMQRIVVAQDCTCPVRYPEWTAAEAVYFETFATAEYWVVNKATSDNRQLANELRLEAMPICVAAGNW